MSSEVIIIDIDEMGKTAVPLDASAVVRGVIVQDIYHAFEMARIRLGNPPINLPTIINDAKHPVHFGITINWQVLLNLASIPPGLEGKEMLDWLLSFPIYHEINHYVACPYDAVTHAKFMIDVMKAWKTALVDECLYIINFFSDIIVNTDLFHFFGDQFFNAMQKWIEHTVVETFNTGHKVSLSYLIFVLVHEMMWNRSFSSFNYPDKARIVAGKINDIFLLSKDWDEIVSRLTDALKDVMIDETRRGAPGFGMDVVAFDIEKAKSSGSKCQSSGDDPGEQGSGSGASGNDAADQKQQKKDKNSGNGSTASGNDKVLVTIKKNDKYVKKPFDMAFFMGDPTSEKTRGNINENEKLNEVSRVTELIEQSGMPFGKSSLLMKYMHIDDELAWRIWLRARARGIMKYEAKTVQDNKGTVLPSQWNWEDRIENWNIFSSIMNFYKYPFPPFSTGFKERRAPNGGITLPDVRDLLIVRDSSGSMREMMKGTKVEKWKRSLDVINKENNKFNLSSLAVFTVLHAACAKGAKFAVINFSGDYVATDWLRSSDRESIDDAERVILKYIGDGTVIPIDKIKQLLDKKRHVYVIIFTDSELYNWNEFFKNIDYFHDNDHSLAMIFTSSRLNARKSNVKLMKRLDDNSIVVHVVNTPADLFNVTVREVKRIYAS